MNQDERAEAVSHCRYVDEVITDAPWLVTPEFLKKHKIDYVIHGEDDSYDENGEDAYKLVKEMGVFCTIKRTEGISTSDIILRIVRDYDDFIKRNLSRGYTFGDMNVSFGKKSQIQVSRTIEDIKKGVGNVTENIRDRTGSIIFDLKQWKDFSEHIFLDCI
jgi:glycerol-3-phosphate cytidylyltransferase-like family protein